MFKILHRYPDVSRKFQEANLEVCAKFVYEHRRTRETRQKETFVDTRKHTCKLDEICGRGQIRCGAPVRTKHVGIFKTHGRCTPGRSARYKHQKTLTSVHVSKSKGTTHALIDLQQHITDQKPLFHAGRTRTAPTQNTALTGLQPASMPTVAAASMSQPLQFTWQNPGPGRVQI